MSPEESVNIFDSMWHVLSIKAKKIISFIAFVKCFVEGFLLNHDVRVKSADQFLLNSIVLLCIMQMQNKKEV